MRKPGRFSARFQNLISLPTAIRGSARVQNCVRMPIVAINAASTSNQLETSRITQ
jgi:hypothetical protein